MYGIRVIREKNNSLIIYIKFYIKKYIYILNTHWLNELHII